jgi:hypothetical protein
MTYTSLDLDAQLYLIVLVANGEPAPGALDKEILRDAQQAYERLRTVGSSEDQIKFRLDDLL